MWLALSGAWLTVVGSLWGMAHLSFCLWSLCIYLESSDDFFLVFFALSLEGVELLTFHSIFLFAAT